MNRNLTRMLVLSLFIAAITLFIAYKTGYLFNEPEPVDPMSEMIKAPKQLISDRQRMIMSSSKSMTIMTEYRYIYRLEKELENVDSIRRDSLYQMILNSESKFMLEDSSFLHQIKHADTIIPIERK